MTAVNGEDIEARHGAVDGRPAVASQHIVHEFPVHAADGQVPLIVIDVAGADWKRMTRQEQRIAPLE